MQNIIFIFIGGAFIGWLASVIAKHDERQGVVGNILVGILGAGLGNWLFTLTGREVETWLSHFILSLSGAVAIILIIKLITYIKNR